MRLAVGSLTTSDDPQTGQDSNPPSLCERKSSDVLNQPSNLWLWEQRKS